MSIRLKILTVCIAFITCIVAVGVLSSRVQQGLGASSKGTVDELSEVAKDIYDNAFMGVNYIRKSQIDWSQFMISHPGDSVAVADDASRDQLQKLMDDLNVAIERAMNDKSRDLAQQILTRVTALHAQATPVPSADLTDLGKQLGRVAERYANDGSNYRDHVDDLLANSEKQMVALSASGRRMLTGINLAAIFMSILFAFFLIHAVVPPLRKAAAIANAIAEGKLDNEIKIGAGGHSETDLLLRSLAKMQNSIADNMHRIEEQTAKAARQAETDNKRRSVLENVTHVVENELRNVVELVNDRTKHMSRQAGGMAEFAQQTGGNAQSAAGAAVESLANAETVSRAADILSTSVRDIAMQTSLSVDTTRRAVHVSGETNDNINALSQAVVEILGIVEFIFKIANQTNLLALNATIEAARAGEAGKGFSVVASEVKNLAKQTTGATEKITGQIANIQAVTGQAVKGMQQIRDIITQIDVFMGSLASAMQEHEAATQEIAGGMKQTSEAAREINIQIEGISAKANTTRENALALVSQVDSVRQDVRTLNEVLIMVMSATEDEGNAPSPAAKS